MHAMNEMNQTIEQDQDIWVRLSVVCMCVWVCVLCIVSLCLQLLLCSSFAGFFHNAMLCVWEDVTYQDPIVLFFIRRLTWREKKRDSWEVFEASGGNHWVAMSCCVGVYQSPVNCLWAGTGFLSFCLCLFCAMMITDDSVGQSPSPSLVCLVSLYLLRVSWGALDFGSGDAR